MPCSTAPPPAERHRSALAILALSLFLVPAGAEDLRPEAPLERPVTIRTSWQAELSLVLRRPATGLVERLEQRLADEQVVERTVLSHAPPQVRLRFQRHRRTEVVGGSRSDTTDPLEGAQVLLSATPDGVRAELEAGSAPPERLRALPLEDPILAALPAEAQVGVTFEATLPGFFTLGEPPIGIDARLEGHLEEVVETPDGSRVARLRLRLSSRHPGPPELLTPAWKLELEGTLRLDLTLRRPLDMELRGRLHGRSVEGGVELEGGGPVTMVRRWE